MVRKNQNYTNETMELLATSKQAFIRALRTGFGFIPVVKADPSQAEINKFRNQADKLKAFFEKKFKPIFNAWQADAIKSFREQMAQGAPTLLLPEELKQDLAKILTNHYQEVSEAFIPGTSFPAVKQDVIENPVGGPAEGENDNEDDPFIGLVLQKIEQDVHDGVAVNLPVHAGSIINTTEQIGNNARSDSFEEDGELDVFGAAAIMSARMAGRSTTVSVTETEWISQYSENVAIEVTSPLTMTATESQLKDLQSVSPNVRLKTTNIPKLFAVGTAGEIDLFRRQLTNPQKMWVTMGDKKVRTTHRVMEGVMIGLNHAFQLAGGLMMYPTDSSLGASLKEIYGCRCHLFYF